MRRRVPTATLRNSPATSRFVVAPPERRSLPADEEPAPVPASVVQKIAGNGKGLSAAGIDRWLIQSGFAIRNSHGLRPTEQGLEAAAALDFLD
jgi:hypothetical protein